MEIKTKLRHSYNSNAKRSLDETDGGLGSSAREVRAGVDHWQHCLQGSLYRDEKSSIIKSDSRAYT